MIALVGAALVALALAGAGVLFGILGLATMAVGALQSTVSGRLGTTMGHAGAVGIGWGVSRFAGRFATPILVWAVLLLVVAAAVGALTWEMPQTLIGAAVGAGAGLAIARGVPAVVEGMIKRRLAKGILHR